MLNFESEVELLIKNAGGQKRAASNYKRIFEDKKSDFLSKDIVKIGNTLFEYGKMYKFRYDPQSEYLPWYDTSPLVICLNRHSTSPDVDTCVNLNLLPFKIKVNFLHRIFREYNSILNQQIEGNHSYNALNQKSLNISYDILYNIIDKLYINYAVRNYINSRKSDTYLISYENWSSMILLEDFDFQNTSAENIYLQYFKMRRKRNNKK